MEELPKGVDERPEKKWDGSTHTIKRLCPAQTRRRVLPTGKRQGFSILLDVGLRSYRGCIYKKTSSHTWYNSVWYHCRSATLSQQTNCCIHHCIVVTKDRWTIGRYLVAQRGPLHNVTTLALCVSPAYIGNQWCRQDFTSPAVLCSLMSKDEPWTRHLTTDFFYDYCWMSFLLSRT